MLKTNSPTPPASSRKVATNPPVRICWTRDSGSFIAWPKTNLRTRFWTDFTVRVASHLPMIPKITAINESVTIAIASAASRDCGVESIVEESGTQRMIETGSGSPEKTLSMAIFVAAGGKSSRLAEMVAHSKAVATARLSRRTNEKKAFSSGPIDRDRLALISVPCREMIVRSDRRLLRRAADST